MPKREALRRAGSLLVVLVAVDLVTKALAFVLLPYGESTREDAWFQLVLMCNETGLGSWALSFAGGDRAAGGIGDLAAKAGALDAGLGLWFLLLHRLRWSRASKIAVVVASVAAASVINRELPRWHQSLISGAYTGTVGFTVFALCVRHLAPPGPWRGTATLFAASGLGNSLCLLWPPHEVVDFIYVPSLSRLLRIGVFNLADLYHLAGLACLLLLLARALLSGLARIGANMRAWQPRGRPP